MPAFFGANRPRTANVIGAGSFRIILAFAIHSTDGMNRRQIQNVKSHPSHVIQLLLAIRQRAMRPRLTARAWKHFIPRAKARLLPIHNHRQFPAVGTGMAPIGVLDHQRRQFRIQRFLYRFLHPRFM